MRLPLLLIFHSLLYHMCRQIKVMMILMKHRINVKRDWFVDHELWLPPYTNADARWKCLAYLCQQILAAVPAVEPASEKLSIGCNCDATSVQEYVFYVFQDSKNAFLRSLEMTCQKSRKRYQSFRRKSIKSL